MVYTIVYTYLIYQYAAIFEINAKRKSGQY